MRRLANHIIEIAERRGLPVTNLQLQKVMFFALGMHLRRVGIDDLAQRTYDSPFDKWRYGPVVQSIYYSFNHLGDNDITETTNGEYDFAYQKWDETILNLLQIDVFKLVRVSHDMPSWANYQEEILAKNVVESYTLEEIAEDFRR